MVISDIHYAGPAERARRGWESRAIRQPVLRLIAAAYRHVLWLADPTAHNPKLDQLIAAARSPDLVVLNGDLSCDSAFIGVADDAAFESAVQCLERLRAAFGARLLVTIGDHELGKMSLFGGAGGPRLASWHRTIRELGVQPFWQRDWQDRTLIGVCSTLLALPAFAPELLESEREEWNRLREEHLAGVRDAFERLAAEARVLLFCHDPTALPFLAAEPAVHARLHQIERTVIGHLHSELILRTGRLLSGMPQLAGCGVTVRRLSGALRRARNWSRFNVVLCPSPPGIQLLRDGGWLELERDGDRLAIQRRRIRW